MKRLLFSVMATIGFTAASMAQSVPSYLPTNGLVGWWPFNGNANDESGNGNNGTVNGASLTSDRNGNVNNAYSFDGSSNYIDCGQMANLGNFPTVFTQNAWILAAQNQSNYCKMPIISKRQSGSNSWATLGAGGNGTIGVPWINQAYFFVNAPGYVPGITNALFSSTNTNDAQWHMVTGTKSGNIYKLYFDGILQDSIIDNYSPLGSTDNMIFGHESIWGFSCEQWYEGKLDDIGIWNRALTQQEISDLYNSVNCSNNLTITPSNNNLATGSLANFTATTSDPNPSFVWQSDFGQGFQTLNNYGNYSGVNSSSLSISNVQLANHNQPIRAISTSGNCIDTSNVAMIMISDTCINTINDTNFITVTDTLIINAVITGVNPPNNQNTIKVFPNPASTHITINYGNFASMNGYQLIITNALGQQVFNTNITQQSDYIDLSTWSGNGVYFVHLIDPQGQTVDIRKIVLQ